MEEDYSQMAIRVIISLILSAPLLKDNVLCPLASSKNDMRQ